MVQTYAKTAIAFQGGGALGAFAYGALRRIYEAEPGFRPSCVSGVSIGAFTAAIVASHPADPLPKLAAFWDELTVDRSELVFTGMEQYVAVFGNRAFYLPRSDYLSLPNWTSFYDLEPITKTLPRYVDFETIAKAEVKLVVTATNIATGDITPFSNKDPGNPLTMDHLIASGSLPPSYPPRTVGTQAFWDGGLFDNTPLSALFDLIEDSDAAATRVIVINLFPNAGRVPKNMLDVWDRMTELQFANKTAKDVALAQKINKLVAVIEKLQGAPVDSPGSILRSLPDLADVAKFKLFDNIIPIVNQIPEPVSSSCDFSMESINRRIEAGYRAATAALAHQPKCAAEIKAAL